MAETVYVVDDDPDIRDSLSMLLQASGYQTRAFESATSFLSSDAPNAVGCLIVDVQMPEMDGITLQKELVSRRSPLQVVVMTGHGDIPIAVGAMKAGAVDFLEKPFEEEVLLGSVRRALDRASTAGDHAKEARNAASRLALLTDRERQVLDLIVAGKANKVIAHELSISPRTVEIHRARVMEKMDAGNLADLVRKALSITP
ncbi:two-component system response regulator FixJ [Rhizomicrobium palustre]|uniref:Two-component system response regulator FixJ n=1 Tax=Rhizomicrobium palustre TaxID=189966 RepID=A0A846N169_9PROT|nr:response regulator FixJ [Rhizomicrobium palustre]NIK88907.1 two-component system response regulator FixJ [Rhizomicrobium palustre]